MCCKVSETTRSISAIRMISSAESQNTSQEKFLPLNQDLPVRLVYYIEACNILDDAIEREKQFKTGFGRAYLNRRLSDIKN